MKIRFLIAGIVSTFVAFFTFPVTFKYFIKDLFFTSFIIAQTINILISFILQKYFVFKISGWSNVLLIRFYLNAIKLQIVNYVFLFLLVNILYLDFIYSNIFMTIIIAIASFYLHKINTFKIIDSKTEVIK